MTGTNPFEDNPWSGNGGGPRFGNAYEDDSGKHETPQAMTMPEPGGGSYLATSSPALPPRSSPALPPRSPALPPRSPARMPSPSDYRTTTTTMTWNESNKTEHESPTLAEPQNAYQYSGTRLGNQDFSSTSAYSPPSQPAPSPKPENVEASLPAVYNGSKNPSRLRFLLRVLQLVTSVGSIGFAAGASPAAFSFAWSCFHVFIYLRRRLFSGDKLNRPVMAGIDLLLAILWGIGVIVEMVKYRCPPGGYNHWCDFYNVSIFWGFLAFALFVAAAGLDIAGACVNSKK
ncbi:hypothetical protein DFQ28_001703 [Apophysomyces sp. BC1034]|nr:hypothetical protein DFQ29_001207 [Apophysomyces sp. BC1021]KAG0190675.1 hypothetical protein DFQ28_001703 [Apophysomyces sp. BC1034]